MAKTKQQKDKLYSDYSQLLADYQTIVLLDMNAIKTKDVEGFKNKLEEVDSKYVLIKNTIFNKALEAHNKSMGTIEGATGAVFSKEDASIILKKVTDFINENKVANIKVGLIDGGVYDKNKVIEISKLPSKQELIAKLVGSIKSPLYSVVNVFSGVQRNFVYALKAIEESKK